MEKMVYGLTMSSTVNMNMRPKECSVYIILVSDHSIIVL